MTRQDHADGVLRRLESINSELNITEQILADELCSWADLNKLTPLEVATLHSDVKAGILILYHKAGKTYMVDWRKL